MIIDNSIVDRQGITFLLDGQNQKWLACGIGVAKKPRIIANEYESRTLKSDSRVFACIRGSFALASS
jgi:hypothetical protein